MYLATKKSTAAGLEVKIGLFLAIAFTSLLFCSPYPVTGDTLRNGERGSGQGGEEAGHAAKFMVTAANPLAVKAGYQVLKEGGGAVDAAIAVQMVLNLVEPQSSGIGGGAFLLYWDNKNKRLSTYDGRETAPKGATGDLFLTDDGTPRDWWEALAGGLAVGVPGLVGMLEMAHRNHGTLGWARLFKPAIDLAERGFKVSPRLHRFVEKKINPALGRYDAARRFFYPDGKPLATGGLLKNPDLAGTFKKIAALGADGFYKGDIAADIVRTVRQAKDNPGLLTEHDLEQYQALEREPVCGNYREYRICGMGPPTSGGITVLQMLSILSHYDLAAYNMLSSDFIHLYSQAGRLAYADRNTYIADPGFVDVPLAALLDTGYLKQRASLILNHRDMGRAQPGHLPTESRYRTGKSPEYPSTSHISIVDAEGNAVAMTTSIEMAFGSTLMVRGFLLNNQLTDFSFQPEDRNGAIANRVEGGKRPRSSMSPMMVFGPNNKLKLVIGSPGGSQIINYVAKTIVAVLDLGMGVQQAVGLPHFGSLNDVTYLEQGRSVSKIKPALEKMDHKVVIRKLNSGLHGILVTEEGLFGGADPRQEGVVMGE